jgi:hypothetical protein
MLSISLLLHSSYPPIIDVCPCHCTSLHPWHQLSSMLETDILNHICQCVHINNTASAPSSTFTSVAPHSPPHHLLFKSLHASPQALLQTSPRLPTFVGQHHKCPSLQYLLAHVMDIVFDASYVMSWPLLGPVPCWRCDMPYIFLLGHHCYRNPARYNAGGNNKL